MPHLLRLVAMVANFSMHEINVNNFFYYFLVIYSIFINNHGKQHKILRSDPLLPNDSKVCY